MNNTKILKILKILILIVAIILLILVGRLLYEKILINKFENILNENDSSNYQLIQTEGDEITTVKVCGNVLTLEDDESFIWVSQTENQRVVMDKNSKVAIITENPEETLKVSSLNSTYINDYFENSNMQFKYLGKEDDLYKVQFTDKSTGVISVLYINKDTGIVQKITEDYSGVQTVLEFEVTLDCISSEDVSYPDLTEYEIGVSASTTVQSTEDYEPEYSEDSENITEIDED